MITVAADLEDIFRHLKPSRCAFKSHLLSVMFATGFNHTEADRDTSG